MSKDVENQTAGIPVFKDKLFNNGWILNVFQNNFKMMTTSLYDPFGNFVETKSFNTQLDSDVEVFKKYVEYFNEDPKKNLQKMLSLKVRLK